MVTSKTLDQITKEEFQDFETVRRSGVVNMYSHEVVRLAGISPEAHVGIIKHYDKLAAKWPDVRKVT